jgi:DNA repair exonuclease SbcCD ATPase subunit
MILNQEQLDELYKLIEDSNKRQEELAKEHAEWKAKIASNQQEIKNNNERNEQLQKENYEHQKMLVKISNEHNPLFGVVEDAEAKITTHKREKAVKELYEKQTPFYEALEKVIGQIQDELKDTVSDFVSFVPAKDATAALKSAMESDRNFSAHTSNLREARHQYEQCLKDLCEKKVDGKTINLKEVAIPNDILKRHAKSEDYVRYWRKE